MNVMNNMSYSMGFGQGMWFFGLIGTILWIELILLLGLAIAWLWRTLSK